MALLLREALGDSLRRTRVAQSRTLREVSTTARVSLGYLSEVERGRKEASSELLNAICEALDVPLSHVLVEVSESLTESGARAAGAARGGDAMASAVDADPAAGTVVDERSRVVVGGPQTRALAAA